MAERPHQNLPTPIKALYDAAHLAQLHGLAFVDGAWSKRAFADLLEQKTVTALGHQNGFILLQILPDGAEILTLAVHPDMRRCGLARRLMAHMMTALRPAQIWLEVAADNYPAQALYSGFGFIEYGRRRKYYKRAGNFPVDAVLMRLDSQEGAQHEQKIGT
ncbi:MAG: GNAT family N-acetyltransferase [Alphaproteobacteria bacterium]|jgi:ribosomal-protein-alanine N-acetyltransferase|nr:GNAT family N-acetyltransferase [Alphaproteobacteria bacterium]